MERKYKCRNGVIERTRFLVSDNARPRSSKTKGNTPPRKQEANFNSALRRLARILNCNYTHESGLLITLDYDQPGLRKLCGLAGLTDTETAWAMGKRVDPVGSWAQAGKKHTDREQIAPEMEKAMGKLRQAAEKQMNLWLRRVKRHYGSTLRYVAVTSDIDGETGEVVRIHHHLPVEAAGISWDLLQQQWRLGSVDIRRLREQADYTPIAVYLLRQVRRQPDAKKYAVSRGMLMPEITERVVLGSPEIKAPAGARVLERSEYNPETVVQYIRYVPKLRTPHRKGRGKNEQAEI